LPRHKRRVPTARVKQPAVKKFKVYSWNGGASSKELSRALGCKRIKRNASLYIPRRNHVVINWGSSTLPAAFLGGTRSMHSGVHRILNQPNLVATATNKLRFFEFVRDSLVTPMYWTRKAEAQTWLNERRSRRVVVRAVLNGHSGVGITIVQSGQSLPDAPLYVAYVPKAHEYRVHILLGEVIFVQRKARSREVPDDRVNWQVRNLAGGFIYQNQGVNPPQTVVDVARACHTRMQLDFGAYDVVTNDSGQAFVLEVNTAPGLAGTTLDKYREGFARALHSL
jgi:hypothetical protein